MEIINLENDIKVVCIKASSFPNGVMIAHKKIHALFPNIKQRKVFGISRLEGTEIIYKAAAEIEAADILDTAELEIFILRKGEYLSEFIKDFMKDVSQIGQAFQLLIKQPDIDPEGYCVEDYLNETDVRCMVRIKRRK